MKPDAAIINTSRGGIVNEADLARLMKEGHLSGAAIDVFDVELLTMVSWRTLNVVSLPLT